MEDSRSLLNMLGLLVPQDGVKKTTQGHMVSLDYPCDILYHLHCLSLIVFPATPVVYGCS